MIKFIYTVNKDFALSKDENNEFSICEELAEFRGSIFSKGDEYVDYESDSKDVNITSITKLLVSRGFLDLNKQIEL